MNTPSSSIELTVQDHVATVVMNRPPHNFVDAAFMQELADALDMLGRADACRAIVLCSAHKTFCAGADLAGAAQGDEPADPAPFYRQAMRLFACTKPMVAAVAGAAIGAGLGLALACDFRIATPAARFSANFCRLGFHPGFGLSLTLPRLIGPQRAAQLFYTGRRIDGREAARIGLVDELVEHDALEAAAALAREIATSAPLAVASTRASLRAGLAEEVAQANRRELEIQRRQFRTHDFKEGVAAMSERRRPDFLGR